MSTTPTQVIIEEYFETKVANILVNFRKNFKWPQRDTQKPGETGKNLKLKISCQTLFKGPKLELFGFKVFTQIRPVWIGDLGTKPKNSNL